MFDKVAKTVSDYKMFDGKDKVIVALSGGADSMSLLHCLAKNAELFGITVSAAHLNHMLRGEESERDFSFVIEQCKSLNVEIFTKYADIAKIAGERKIGLEECGREERYRFFAELAKDNHTVIATAHTASDNAETVLMNITRGSGMEGLCGIPPVRGNVVRPLINCSRADIERYCKDNNISWVLDSSNLSLEYNRNKIRNSVLPVLKQINPSVENAINRLSDIANKNIAYIGQAAMGEYNRCINDDGLNIGELKKCDNNILSDVIKYAIDKNFDITAEKKHIEIIENIIKSGHGAVEIRKNLTVKAVGDNLVFEKLCDRVSNNKLYFKETVLKLDNKFQFNNKIYVFSPKKIFSSENNNKINKKLLNTSLSCDIISCDTIIRHRKSGDVFKPVERNCTKTVKKLFTEMKVPVSVRDELLVIAKGNNVYWIETIGASQDAAVKDEDSEYFTVTVDADKEDILNE